MATRKRIILSLAQKAQLIEDKRGGKYTNEEIQAKYGLKKTAFYAILAQSETILEEASISLPTIKRARVVKDEILEEAILSWFKEQRSQNTPICGQILREKALALAKCFGNTDFKASEGWLSSFKKRHSIVFKSIQGEENDVNVGDLQNWQKDILHKQISDYRAADVFNLDETGLFWRCSPDSTLAFKGEKCSGGKKIKGSIDSSPMCEYGWIRKASNSRDWKISKATLL